MRRCMIVLFLSLGLILSLSAQDASFTTTISERTAVHAGPGHTYREIIWLGAEVEITVLERNAIGNWLYIQRAALPGTETIDGWVKTGFVNLPDDLKFSEFPVNDDLPDADTSGFLDPDIVRLYNEPVIPEIHDSVREIFAHGQELGNHPNVVTKVGDSNSASRVYLPSVGEVEYDLGPYDFLQDTVDYFGASFQTGSIAARVGMNAFSVFDPIWSNPEKCEANEAPLICEYRNTKPALSLIMYGPNDLRALNTDQYRAQMSQIVQQTLERGIIPVLSTFSSVREEDTWFQAVRFNIILLDIAESYDVPIINLWSAARALPRNGIGEDTIHLTTAGASVDLNGLESRYGISLQNLIVLCTLDRIREVLELP